MGLAALPQVFTELLQQRLLLLVELHRRFYHGPAQQVAHTTTAHWLNALATQPKQFTGLGLGRYLQFNAAVERRYFEFTTQSGIGKGDGYLTIEILAIAFKNRMLLD